MPRRVRNKFLKARIYRDHAEKLRAIAGGLRDDQERSFLAAIASDYERQASLAEERGRFAEAVEIRTP